MIDVMRISLKFRVMESINWKKTQLTLSSTGAGPRDLSYAVKQESMTSQSYGYWYI
jgi:hypothetical protein